MTTELEAIYILRNQIANQQTVISTMAKDMETLKDKLNRDMKDNWTMITSVIDILVKEGITRKQSLDELLRK